jgi:hypothetical protein
MVKRKAQAKQSASDEPEITAGETIIDAELETAKSGQRFSRSEIMSGAALGLSVGAIALALWPVFTAKLATEKQQALSQRVETLSVAVESLANAQTELAQTVIDQQGLSGALKKDIESLTEQANSLTENLRAEIESLARQLEQNQQEWLEGLSRKNSENISSETAQPASPVPEDSAEPGKPVSDISGKDQTWLPKWVEVPIDNLAGWFSGLITIRKTEDGQDSRASDSAVTGEGSPR